MKSIKNLSVSSKTPVSLQKEVRNQRFGSETLKLNCSPFACPMRSLPGMTNNVIKLHDLV